MTQPTDQLLVQTIDRFWDAFPPVWNAVRSHVRGQATENYDLTVEQFHILRHVRKGRSSVSDLANVRCISRPAVSQAVAALVRKGLIKRRQSPDDRRCVVLELTAAGKALLDQVFGETRLWMKTRLSGLNAEELEMISSALSLIRSAFA